MNLKKIALTAYLLCALSVKCGQERVDTDWFDKKNLRSLWQEILTSTGNNPHLPMPKIVLYSEFPHYKKPENCARYSGRRKISCEKDNEKVSGSMTLARPFSPKMRSGFTRRKSEA